MISVRSNWPAFSALMRKYRVGVTHHHLDLVARPCVEQLRDEDVGTFEVGDRLEEGHAVELGTRVRDELLRGDDVGRSPGHGDDQAARDRRPVALLQSCRLPEGLGEAARTGAHLSNVRAEIQRREPEPEHIDAGAQVGESAVGDGAGVVCTQRAVEQRQILGEGLPVAGTPSSPSRSQIAVRKARYWLLSASTPSSVTVPITVVDIPQPCASSRMAPR